MYNVFIKKRILKNAKKIPEYVQKIFSKLLDDLRDKGPIRAEYPGFSKLEANKYHCHLKYKWVACRRCKENSILIEVYYAGSRENAPY